MTEENIELMPVRFGDGTAGMRHIIRREGCEFYNTGLDQPEPIPIPQLEEDEVALYSTGSTVPVILRTRQL